jgi:hypothetical protein
MRVAQYLCADLPSGFTGVNGDSPRHFLSGLLLSLQQHRNDGRKGGSHLFVPQRLLYKTSGILASYNYEKTSFWHPEVEKAWWRGRSGRAGPGFDVGSVARFLTSIV